jgi:hypothetical protein
MREIGKLAEEAGFDGFAQKDMGIEPSQDLEIYAGLVGLATDQADPPFWAAQAE